MTERRARDPDLLDALDALGGAAFEGTVWRIVREGRDPVQGYPARARWDPGLFDVLYTSLAREGALAEIHYHLSRQPVFPSRLVSVVHRITVRTSRTLKLADLAALEPLGVEAARYGALDYRRTQEIGDAAYFLGFDGLIVPSARWNCQNLVLFTDRLAPEDFAVEESAIVHWSAWRREAASRRKTQSSPGGRSGPGVMRKVVGRKGATYPVDCRARRAWRRARLSAGQYCLRS